MATVKPAIDKRLSWASVWVVLILMLGVGIRLYFVSALHIPLISDMASFDQRAMALLQTGYFSTNDNPLSLGASTYRPPLYPLFLAGIYGAFGHEPQHAYIAQSLLSAFFLWGVYRLALRNIPEPYNKASAILAMAACVFYPPLIGYCGILLSEILFITLLVWAVYWLLKSPVSVASLGLAGFLFGLASLARPIAVPLMMGLLVLQWFTKQRTWKQIVLVVLLWAITLSPWVLRNYQEFHTLVLVDNSSGINLVAGNNDQADGDYTRGFQQSWMYQDALKHSHNIVELDHRLIENNNRWVAQHPERYFKLLLKRWGYYFVSEHEFYSHAYQWNRIPWHKTEWNLAFRLVFQIMALIMLLTCVWARCWPGILLGYCGVFFYIFPALALYYNRYRHPALPFVFILGAWGWVWLCSRLWHSVRHRAIQHNEKAPREKESLAQL